jgi:hypothetical protein
MKQILGLRVLRIVALCLLLFAVGCGSAVPTSSPTSTITPLVIETSAPVATSTVALPSPTFTAMVTDTPTPTPTPAPTLPPDEAQALLLDLLQNNAGCRLPCWWGFTPGQTSWETARQFLSSFATEIYIPSSAPPSHFFADVIFLVPKEIFPTYLTQKYQVEEGVIVTIETIPGYNSSYNLSAFLSTYGMPGEVWLRTYDRAREGDLQFDVVLFYPKQGILARYATQAQVVGNRVRGCPQQKPAAILALWSPERELTFSEATSQTTNIRDEEWWPYRSLDEVTGMDGATFYQIFKESNNSTCLETPAELWPQP